MRKIFIGPGNKLIMSVRLKNGKLKQKEIPYASWYDTENGKVLAKLTHEEYELAIQAKQMKQWIDKVY